MSPRFHDDQGGVALITAMLAVVILSGLVVVFVGHAYNSTRQAGIEQQRENALHAGEAASDDIVSEINVVEEFVNAVRPVPPPADEEAWVRTLAQDTTDVPEADLVTTGFGQGYAIRPCRDSDGDGTCDSDELALDVIYAIGWSPSRDAVIQGHTNARSRVMKLRITTGFLAPEDAIFTCGDLELGGSAQTGGIAGNVYVGGDVINTGNNWEINGDLAATGAIPNEADDNVTGTVTRDAPDRGCSSLNLRARTFYNQEEKPNKPVQQGANPDRNASSPYYGRDSVTSDPVFWYDLCPPGEDGEAKATVRVPDPDGEPCATPPATQGDPDAPNPGYVEWRQGDTSGSQGWDFKNGRWKATNLQSGIFYIYHADAEIQGGNGAVTIFIERTGQDSDMDYTTTDDWYDPVDDGKGADNGSLDLSGNPTFRNAFANVQFLAERDFAMNGTTGTELDGGILVGEQFDVRGNASINGAIIASEKPHTAGSPVSTSKSAVAGDMQIVNDGGLRIPIHEVTRITFWNEL